MGGDPRSTVQMGSKMQDERVTSHRPRGHRPRTFFPATSVSCPRAFGTGAASEFIQSIRKISDCVSVLCLGKVSKTLRDRIRSQNTRYKLQLEDTP